jgi:hypothetical protein
MLCDCDKVCPASMGLQSFDNPIFKIDHHPIP